MLVERLLGFLAKGIIVELAAGGADDRQLVRQQAVGVEPVQRRQQHAPGQIAGRPEQQQCGSLIGHALPYAAAAGNAAGFLGVVPASSSRKLRPRVSRPAQAMRPADSAIGPSRAAAAPASVGISPASANPCTATPPNLLLPATRPVARPRTPSA